MPGCERGSGWGREAGGGGQGGGEQANAGSSINTPTTPARAARTPHCFWGWASSMGPWGCRPPTTPSPLTALGPLTIPFLPTRTHNWDLLCRARPYNPSSTHPTHTHTHIHTHAHGHLPLPPHTRPAPQDCALYFPLSAYEALLGRLPQHSRLISAGSLIPEPVRRAYRCACVCVCVCVCVWWEGGGCKNQPKLNQNQRKPAEHRQRR